MGKTANEDGTATSHWRVGFPINNYAVSLNIGPYVPVETIYNGLRGDRHETIVFWTTPERLEDARRTCEKLPRLLESLGRRFGEYPFFADKLWVVHAPYLGMEHQTLIAYGADFTDTAYGIDWVLAHELAHEWWGNKITASDWSDAWLHEGFSSYAEALVVLDTLGEDSYLAYMHELRARMTNQAPMVAGSDLTSMEALVPDTYGKGAWVLHMLRDLLGGDALDVILWRFADGDNPETCRFVTTQDFIDLVAEISGWELDWFWNRYLYTAELPVWTMARTSAGGSDRIAIAWDDPSFEMPLPVRVGDSIDLVAMPGGRAELTVEAGIEVEVDPDREVLVAER
jgi:aminopeptidase N